MKSVLAAVLLIAASALVAAPAAEAQTEVTARLRAFDEVPAITSVGNGNFTATFNEDFTAFDFELTLPDLATDITQSHIHFAQKGVNGGIVLFFCTNLGNGPAGTQTCPANGGTVTGTIAAAQIVGSAAAQGIGVGNFWAVQRAMRNNSAYVNVHTVQFPGGELRGQVAVVATNAAPVADE